MNIAYKKYNSLVKSMDVVVDKREDLKTYLLENTKNSEVLSYLKNYIYQVSYLGGLDTLDFVEEFIRCAYHQVIVGKKVPRELVENGYLEGNIYQISYRDIYYNDNFGFDVVWRYSLEVEIDIEGVVVSIRRVTVEDKV